MTDPVTPPPGEAPFSRHVEHEFVPYAVFLDYRARRIRAPVVESAAPVVDPPTPPEDPHFSKTRKAGPRS